MLSMISIVGTDWSMRIVWTNHSQLNLDSLRWNPHSQCCNCQTHLTSKASCGGGRNGGETNGGDVRLGGVHPHPLHPVHWDGRRLAWRGFLHHILVGPRAHIYIFGGKTITWKEAVELFAALVPSHRVDRRGGGVGAVQSGVSTQLNSFFIFLFLKATPFCCWGKLQTHLDILGHVHPNHFKSRARRVGQAEICFNRRRSKTMEYKPRL